MAVEDVFAPKPTKQIDPRSMQGKDKIGDDLDPNFWEKKARAAASKREYESEMRKSENPPPPPQESPFKVTGEFNLGKVDIQEEQRRMREEQEKQRRESDARAQQLEKERDEAKGDLQRQQLENMQKQFDSKMDELRRDINEGRNQDSISKKFAEIEELGKMFGWKRNDNTGQDPHVTLEIERMRHDDSKADREFQWRMHQDQKNWDMEKIKLTDEREFRRAQLSQQARRDEMFASLPQRLGSVIAKGLIENEESDASEESDAEESPAIKKRPKGKGGKSYHIEAGEGEAGETECLGCGEPVGIGPTARSAICSSCGSKYRIDRVKQEV